MNEFERKLRASQAEIDQGKAVMEFYVNKFFESKVPELKRLLVANNPTTDPVFVEAQIDEVVNSHRGELVDKFNASGMLVLTRFLQGKMDLLRYFESKYVLLLRETLISKEDVIESLEAILDYMKTQE